METFFYVVISIDGDYAHLQRIDEATGEVIPPEADEELKLVARALLPAEIREGSRLKYQWLQYELQD